MVKRFEGGPNHINFPKWKSDCSLRGGAVKGDQWGGGDRFTRPSPPLGHCKGQRGVGPTTQPGPTLPRINLLLFNMGPIMAFPRPTLRTLLSPAGPSCSSRPLESVKIAFFRSKNAVYDM